eukprot:gene21419-27449_t
MTQCKTSRGGVSVHLSTEIVGKAVAGEEVVLKTTSDKIGKALGFCTMELHTTDGRLLARGKHIKYMPMGSLWDFIASPMFLPITLAIYEYLTTSSFGKYLMSLFSKKKSKKHTTETVIEKEKEIVGVGAVFTELGLKTVDYSEAYNSTSGRRSAFEFRAGRHLHNLMDKLHGGAVAAAIEEACMMTRRSAPTTESGVGGAVDRFYVQSMEVRYLAPMKGELIITCEDDDYSPSLSVPSKEELKLSSRTTGKVVNKKSGVVSVEYVCVWGSADSL